MSFFDEVTKKKIRLAVDRTTNNLDDSWRYLSQHPVEASLVIGALAGLMVCIPISLMFGLLVGAFALVYFNMFDSPNASERFASVFGARC